MDSQKTEVDLEQFDNTISEARNVTNSNIYSMHNVASTKKKNRYSIFSALTLSTYCSTVHQPAMSSVKCLENVCAAAELNQQKPKVKVGGSDRQQQQSSRETIVLD